MNDTTLNQSSIPSWQPTSSSLYLISVLISGWTVGANAVILVCFYLYRNHQFSSFCRLLTSMTISDLLVGLVWAINLGINQNKGQVIELICSTTLYLIVSLQCVSLYHVLSICVLRNKVLRNQSVQGLEEQQKRWIIIIISISWAVPMVIMGIPIAIWARLSVNETICRLDMVFGENVRKATFFGSTFYLTSQLLTDIVYCTTVIHLWIEMRKHGVSVEPVVVMNVETEGVATENTHVTTSDIAKRRLMKYQSDITVTIGYLLILFNILTLPNTIGGFIVGSVETAKPNVILLTNSLFILNSGLNPIVYASRVPWIKDLFKQMTVEVTKCFRIQR